MINIAFIGDIKGRVQYNRYQVLSSYLNNEYKFSFLSAKKKINRQTLFEYDIVYFASYTLYKKVPISHPNIFGSVTSWKCIIGSNSDRDISILSKFDRISVNNLSLYNIISNYHPYVYYIHNGVDTNFFCPIVRTYNNSPLRVGWVGNKDRAVKNYHIFDKLRNIDKLTDYCAVISSKSTPSNKLLNKQQMLDFYRSLDYFLVTSSHEGTPNPALEAAACGIPVISTRVGNMPELIEEGINGFFIEPNINLILQQISALHRMSWDDYMPMSRNIRQTIETHWSWELVVDKYREFFAI